MRRRRVGSIRDRRKIEASRDEIADIEQNVRATSPRPSVFDYRPLTPDRMQNRDLLDRPADRRRPMDSLKDIAGRDRRHRVVTHEIGAELRTPETRAVTAYQQSEYHRFLPRVVFVRLMFSVLSVFGARRSSTELAAVFKHPALSRSILYEPLAFAGDCRRASLMTTKLTATCVLKGSIWTAIMFAVERRRAHSSEPARPSQASGGEATIADPANRHACRCRTP
nr:hypothetical protein [Sphingomonas faeni]